MMKLAKQYWILGLLALLTTGFAHAQKDDPRSTALSEAKAYFYPVSLVGVPLTKRQMIYVPTYSHIYLSGKGKRELATTLSLRNTDPKQRIIINAVRYYNTNGDLLEELVKNDYALNSMATMVFVIEQKDKRGGSGANFIIEWAAETATSQPIFQAVMAGISGTQSMSFITDGQVVEVEVP